jgi:hypothetical protein
VGCGAFGGSRFGEGVRVSDRTAVILVVISLLLFALGVAVFRKPRAW